MPVRKIDHIVLVFLLFSAVSISYPAACAGQEARTEAEEFNFANGLFSRGMYDMAIEGYRDFLKNHPRSSYRETARYRISEAYFLSGRYSEALISYRDFLRQYPSSEFVAGASARIGQIHYNEGRYDKAESSFNSLLGRKDLEDDIRNVSFYYLGKVYGEQGNPREAEKMYSRIIASGGDTRYRTFAHLGLGEIYLSEGEEGPAAEEFAKAVASAEDKAMQQQAAIKAAGIYRSMGKNDKASGLYDVVLEEPGAQALLDAAVIGKLSTLHASGEYAKMMEYAERFFPAVSDEEIKAQILFIKGNRYFNTGELEKAEKMYSNAKHDYPATVYGMLSMLNEAWTLYRRSQYEKALIAVNEYMEASDGTKTDEAVFIRGKIYSDTGGYEDALREFGRLMEEYPGSSFAAEALYQSAWLREETGENEKAAVLYSRFARKYPDDERSPAMLIKAAQMYRRLGNTEAAVSSYKELLSVYPEDQMRERAMFQLGALFVEEGMDRKGIDILENFIEVYPDSEVKGYALFSLGRAYQNEGHWEKAIAAFGDIPGGGNAEKELYARSREAIAYSYFKKGQPEKAASEYYDIITSQSNVVLPPGVHIWCAEYFLSRGENRRSLDVLESMTSGGVPDEKRGEYYYLLGSNYAELEEIPRAIGNFNRAIEEEAVSPYYERSYLGLGKAYLARAEYEKALNALEKALSSSEDPSSNARIRFEIGNINYTAGNYEEAGKQYMMVAILFEDRELSPKALMNAGISFLKAGKKQESEKAFDELLERYPGSPEAEKIRKEYGEKE
jgi:tetratricopeptide (TPR) repeat protein